MFRLKMSHHQGFLLFKLPLCSPSSALFKKQVLRVLLDPWFGHCNTVHYNRCVVVDGSRDVRCNKLPGYSP
jgi:hypothetical protein